jgi:hypothetical protein
MPPSRKTSILAAQLNVHPQESCTLLNIKQWQMLEDNIVQSAGKPYFACITFTSVLSKFYLHH